MEELTKLLLDMENNREVAPKEINEFLKAWEQDSTKAWKELIDRLIGSNHYGERWDSNTECKPELRWSCSAVE